MKLGGCFKDNQCIDDNRLNKKTGTVNLTLSTNHPTHPCAPTKGSAHAHTHNCARMHREFPENVHARVQQRTPV